MTSHFRCYIYHDDCNTESKLPNIFFPSHSSFVLVNQSKQWLWINTSWEKKQKHWASFNIYHNVTDAFQYIHKKVGSFRRKQRNKYHTRAILGALGFAAGASQRQTPPTGSYLSFLCVKWFNYLLSSRQEIRDFMYEVFCRGGRREQAP